MTKLSPFAKKILARTNNRETFPTRYLKPKPVSCFACSMPSAAHCEFPGCALPLCAKHTIKKAGGHLCYAHRGAVLIQENSIPGCETSGDSVPATKFKKSNSFVSSPRI